MTGFKDYALAIVKDHKGNPSSARWLAFASFAAMVVLMWVGRADPKQHTFILKCVELLAWVLIALVGFSQGRAAIEGKDATTATTTATAPSTTPSPLPSPPPSTGSGSPPASVTTPATSTTTPATSTTTTVMDSSTTATTPPGGTQ